MFANNIQQRVERSLFETIRKVLVAQSVLPDIANAVRYPIIGENLTVTAQTNWNTDMAATIASNGWACEVFGASSAFAKGLKRVPRIVIVPKRIIPGEIGLPPGNLYTPDNITTPTTYSSSPYPPESSNFHYDIHLVSSSQAQSRFLNMVLTTVFSMKKYIPFFDVPTDRFFIKLYNFYDVSDTNDGIEENVYSYEVQDLYLFDINNSFVSVKPILEIDTQLIIGYDLTPAQLTDTIPIMKVT